MKRSSSRLCSELGSVPTTRVATTPPACPPMGFCARPEPTFIAPHRVRCALDDALSSARRVRREHDVKERPTGLKGCWVFLLGPPGYRCRPVLKQAPGQAPPAIERHEFADRREIDFTSCRHAQAARQRCRPYPAFQLTNYAPRRASTWAPHCPPYVATEPPHHRGRPDPPHRDLGFRLGGPRCTTRCSSSRPRPPSAAA